MGLELEYGIDKRWLYKYFMILKLYRYYFERNGKEKRCSIAFFFKFRSIAVNQNFVN